MAKTRFIRTKDGSSIPTDNNLKVEKVLTLPVNDDAGINDNPDELGPVRVNSVTGNLQKYTPGSGWADVGAGVYTGSTPVTKQVGGWNIGDDIGNKSYDALFEGILAPYVAPTITNTLLTPTPSPYNQQNVSYSIAYKWSPNVGTGAFTSGQIQYKRSTSGVWINLTTTISTSGSDRIASASVTLNTSGANNDGVDTRVIFVDGGTHSNTSAIYTATFLGYVAPSISFSVGSTTRERGSINTNITGSITRNSPNIALTSYIVQYQVNGTGSWIDIGTPIAASGSSQAISVTHNDTSLNTSTSLNYRVQVVDAQQTTTSGTQTINFYYRLWYGSVSSVPVTSADVRGIATNQLTNAGNSFTLITGTTNVDFVIILPPGTSLVSVIDTGNLNIDVKADYLANTSTISVNDAGGTAVSCTMFRKHNTAAYSPSTNHVITKA